MRPSGHGLGLGLGRGLGLGLDGAGLESLKIRWPRVGGGKRGEVSNIDICNG